MIKTSDGKEFEDDNEGLQKAVDSLHLCLSCIHHNVDCEHFINTSVEIICPEGRIVKCAEYKLILQGEK